MAELGTGTILLVEDSEADVELTLRAFGQAHVLNDVHVVRDGEEALEYLFATGRHQGRVGAPMPDLILLDLKLPKLDGLGVLRRLRGDPRTRRLPVVILTSSNEQRDIIDSYDLGANSYVRKPVDFVEFVQATRQLGVYWLMLNQPAPPEPEGK